MKLEKILPYVILELNPLKIQLLAGNDLCLNSQSSCYVKLYF